MRRREPPQREPWLARYIHKISPSPNDVATIEVAVPPAHKAIWPGFAEPRIRTMYMDRPELRALSAELRAARVLQPGERLHSARWELHNWNVYFADVVCFFQDSSPWWSLTLQQSTPVSLCVAKHRQRIDVLREAGLL